MNMAKLLEKMRLLKRERYISQLENISWVYSTYVAHRSDYS